MSKMDDIAVHQIHAGNIDGADIIFVFNGQRIAVSILPTSPAPYNVHLDRKHLCCEDRLIEMLNNAVSAEVDDDNDEQEEIIDEVVGVILGRGKTHLR
jgi:hypothetical protein